jgi:hypothetical protein
MTRALLLVVLALQLLPACGDLITYPIRHRPGADNPAAAPGEDDVYPPGPGPGSKPQSAPTPTPDVLVPRLDGGPTGPECRPPLGWDPASFCTGAQPRAVVDYKTLDVTSVQANGALPTFAFDLLDAPSRLIANLGDADQVPELPSTHDLAHQGEIWDVKVFPASCLPGPDCPPPRDWLSISHGDHLQGWVEFEQSGDDRLATLCLAITRGPTHVNRQVDLPCTVVLYTPAVVMR